MTPDYIRYLSGEIPGGIFLLAGVLAVFCGVWWLVWRWTGFWDNIFFRRVLIRGVAALILLYVIVWATNRPPHIPTRVVVWAQIPADLPAESWRTEMAADAITARLWASPFPIVPQTSDYTPSLDRIAAGGEGLDSQAKLLRARWIVKVILPTDTPPLNPPRKRGGSDSDLNNPNSERDLSHSDSAAVTVHLLKYSAGKYRELAVLKGRSGGMARSVIELAESIAGRIVSHSHLTKWRGQPLELPDSLFASLYLWNHPADSSSLDSALARLTRLADDHPDWLAPRREIARLLLRHRPGLGEAEIGYQTQMALKADPTDVAALLLAGRRGLYLRRWDEAEAAFKVALSAESDDPRIYFHLSRLDESRYQDIHIKSQVRLLNRALWLAPGYETARLALAEAEWRVEERAVVTDLLKDGLEIDPRSTALLLRLSAKEIEMTRYEDAAAHCRRILEIHPGDPEAQYNLGIADIWLKDYGAALALLDSAYRVGGIVDALYYQGVAYIQQRKWDQAILAMQARASRPQDIYDPGALAARRTIDKIRRKVLNRDTTDTNLDGKRGPEFFFPGK